MPTPPYTGRETRTSLRVLEDLAPGLPEPAMLIGGWAVNFLVQDRWRQTFGEDYFGSRDIDLGFHTHPDRSLKELQAGNMPATVAYLLANGFTRQGTYQIVRYHDAETDEILSETQVRPMPGFAYYAITVDLIASHQRDDLRQVAGFQAFAEELLEPAFHGHATTVTIGNHTIRVPAPHVMLAMKLRSLPQREKNDKSVKDLCDIYALASATATPRDQLRHDLRNLHPISRDAIAAAANSTFLEEAARHLDQRPEIVRATINGLL